MPTEAIDRQLREAEKKKDDELHRSLGLPPVPRRYNPYERTAHQSLDRGSGTWRDETPSPADGAKYIRGEDFSQSVVH